MGAGFFATIFCVAAILLSLLPVAHFGVLNMAAVLTALIGFRYVGFPLFAKLAMGQGLDTFLLGPVGSFGVVLAGVLGYILAFLTSSNLPVGNPLLRPVHNPGALGRISLLAAAIGMIANMAVAIRAGSVYTGVTVASFFTSFLHLALITAVARILIVSRQKRALDAWVVTVLVAELVFAMVRNSRMALMETLLCFVLTEAAYEYKIRWRQLVIVASFITAMVVFITPVFLHVRQFRGNLSWDRRIQTTMDSVSNWHDAFSEFQKDRDLSERYGWYLNYYGRPENVFERMSYINHVDVLKSGTDIRGRVGAKDIVDGIKRTLPRVLAPGKPRGYSKGDWLYAHVGARNVMGGYATAPLIGNGYAAFGWIGAFLYPSALGLLWLVVLKKMAGFDLRANIWVIYLLLRCHNQFVEGSSDAYLIYIFRSLPQDFIILTLIKVLGEGRFLPAGYRQQVN